LIATSPCISCSGVLVNSLEFDTPVTTVTSDCRPWNLPLQLGQCSACGFVQSILDDEWRESSQEIYRSYDSYFQSSSKDQLVFSSGVSESRTQVFVNATLEAIDLPAGARVLDFGCGSGNVLRALSRVRPDLRLDGFDLDTRAESTLRCIPNFESLYSEIPPSSGEYHLVVFSHSLEHLERPALTLHQMTKVLAKGGHVAIALPDCSKDPIKLAVADHCSHFSPQSLTLWLKESGLEARTLPAGTASRECLVVALPSSKIGETPSPSRDLWFFDAAAWLQKAVTQLRNASRQPLTGVFGTSISAAWILAQEPQLARFFVDEDSARNRTFHKRVVYNVDSVPKGHRVLVPFAGEHLTSLLDRLRGFRPDVIWSGLHEIGRT